MINILLIIRQYSRKENPLGIPMVMSKGITDTEIETALRVIILLVTTIIIIMTIKILKYFNLS